MKQCPQCGRTYTDNTLSFCLEDGVKLVAKYDAEATHLNSPQPSDLPPTIAFTDPVAPPPSPHPPAPAPAAPPAPAPTPQRGLRSLVLGALVIGVLIGLGIGAFWLLRRADVPSSNTAAAATPTATPTQTPAPTMTTTPRATPPRPTPTPTASPLATPSPAGVESEPECMLYNDKAERSGVITRADCDTKDCESDTSTIGDEYPDQTRVRVIKGSRVKGKRFTWVKVLLVEKKLTVWVAASKIKC
jgi:hypothetical protein